MACSGGLAEVNKTLAAADKSLAEPARHTADFHAGPQRSACIVRAAIRPVGCGASLTQMERDVETLVLRIFIAVCALVFLLPSPRSTADVNQAVDQPFRWSPTRPAQAPLAAIIRECALRGDINIILNPLVREGVIVAFETGFDDNERTTERVPIT